MLPFMNIMLNIGDYVIHKTTGNCGQIVAHGHDIVNSVYLPTLKVEIVDKTAMNPRTFVEDVTSNWMPLKIEEIPESQTTSKLSNQSSKVLTQV
jgi:hypothetical protein